MSSMSMLQPAAIFLLRHTNQNLLIVVQKSKSASGTDKQVWKARMHEFPEMDTLVTPAVAWYPDIDNLGQPW